MSTATVRYEARFAAEGGPGWAPNYIDPAVLADECNGAMTLLFHDSKWMVVDGQGAVYAEAENPGDLAEWLRVYATALGGMHERGEL